MTYEQSVALADFWHRCKHIDWFYDYIDDGEAYRKASSAMAKLRTDAEQSPEHKAIYDGWKAHFDSAPKYDVAPPSCPVIEWGDDGREAHRDAVKALFRPRLEEFDKAMENEAFRKSINEACYAMSELGLWGDDLELSPAIVARAAAVLSVVRAGGWRPELRM